MTVTPTATASGRGTLVLVGGREFEAPLRGLDERLLGASGAPEVLVLATAAAFEQPADVVERATAHFDGLGAAVRAVPVCTRRDADDDALVKLVKGARFVYLTDGSPLHLRSVLKDTSLLAVLVGGWRGGGVLAASGAGATVLCDPMVDPRGGAYTVGLGLVPRLAVFPHHTSAPDHLWDRSVDLLPEGATLAGIDEHTALVRAPDGSWSVAGAGSVTLYRDHESRRFEAGPCSELDA